MDRDYHFDMIKVLSTFAGLPDEDAQLIAYACQYVDDANEFIAMEFFDGELASIANALPETKSFGLIKGQYFDRVCTGHDDLQSLGGALSSGQLRTYLPFHFVPKDVKGKKTRFQQTDYRTAPNCTIVRELVESAAKTVRGSTGDARKQNLIRLGIALHSFIDSWAHKDFSGLYSSQDNTVTGLKLQRRDTTNTERSGGGYDPVAIDFVASIVPETGHAKAHRFPDCSHHRWTYTNGETHEVFDRNNIDLYMEAAEHAYRHLLAASGSTYNNWELIKQRVLEVTAYYPPSGGTATNPLSPNVIEEKKKKYIEAFPEVRFQYPNTVGTLVDAYDKFQWKDAAYSVFDKNSGEAVSVDSSRLVVTSAGGVVTSGHEAIKGEPFKYKVKGDKRWFWFHIEAHRQREYVFNRIDLPPAANDKFGLLNIVGIVSQGGSAIDNLRSRGFDYVAEGVEIGQRALAKWNPLGVDLSGLGVAKKLEEKVAWQRITIQNSTQWLLKSHASAIGDFEFADQVLAPVADRGYSPKALWNKGRNAFGKVFNKANSVIASVGRGKYWDSLFPNDVPARSLGLFAACEKDNAASMMGGVTVFELLAGIGESKTPTKFTVAFSVPLKLPGNNPVPKVAVARGEDRKAAWNALTAKDEAPSVARYDIGNAVWIRVAVVPGRNTVIVIDRIDREKEDALNAAYLARNPDVARADYGAAVGVDKAWLHFIKHGNSEKRHWGL